VVNRPFFKQMQILYGNGFDENENDNYIRILRGNFINGIKELIQGAETLGREIGEANKKNVEFIKEFSYVEGPIADDVIEKVKEIWTDETIKGLWEMRDGLANLTVVNLDYIIQNIERLCANGAEASNDDIVRCRQRTTGLSEILFPYSKHYFHIFDVGGQKTERRKWDVLSTTQKPTAILFFSSLTDFDVPLLTEEGNRTRMDESIEVWEELLNKEELQNATIILFLNKSDLFEDKIARVNMSETFSDYAGEHSFEEATEYMKKKFISKANGTSHDPDNIHSHVTCAIDTEVMKKVFDSVSAEIFKQRLAMSGLNPIF